MLNCKKAPDILYELTREKHFNNIQVAITDVNDNCPVISPTSAEMTPLPVLVEEPLMYFTSSDADSGDNADVSYIVTEPIARYLFVNNRFP